MLLQLSFAMLLMAFGHLASAQVPLPGRCPEVKVMSEFDLDAYLGVWYENTKYPFIFEIGQKCASARYSNRGNDTISVVNSAVNRLTGNPTSINGIAKVLGPARLAVAFYKSQSLTEANYLVLDTDYANYSVVYSCTDFKGIFHTEIVWILTRERQPSADVIATAKKVLDDNKLSQTFLIDTVQEDCPPVPENTNDDSELADSNAIDKA